MEHCFVWAPCDDMKRFGRRNRRPHEVLINCVESPEECLPLEEDDLPFEEEDPEWSFRYKNNTLFGAVARTKLQVAPCNRGRKLNLQGVET